MEYCGGGSLQDIYHGKITALKCFCFILDRDPARAEQKWTCCAVTGPLSELQIAYVSRETLQVISHWNRSLTRKLWL